MAGSYEHCVDENYKLHKKDTLCGMIEDLRDAYEAIEEMVLMIEFLSKGSKKTILEARDYACTEINNKYIPGQ